MCFRGNIHKFIKTYLVNRKQYKNIRLVKRNIPVNNCGVPRGSVLGPLLYTFFFLSLKAVHYSYEDDTCLIYTGQNIKTLKQNSTTEF